MAQASRSVHIDVSPNIVLLNIAGDSVARARIRDGAKRILRRHGHPFNLQDITVQAILEQNGPRSA